MLILRKALLTEKISRFNKKKNIYGFIVNKSFNKIEIKKVIESTYKVSVKSVNTINYHSKKKTKYINKKVYKGRIMSYKKAIVTLKGKEIIDFYNIN